MHTFEVMASPLWIHCSRAPCLAGLLVLFLVAGGLPAQEEGSVEADKPGLKVGEKAPEFTLKNQDGQEVSLLDLRKKGPIALVFHRSADW